MSLHLEVNSSDLFSVLNERYGLKAVAIKALDGYDDRNYFVECDAVCDNPYITRVSSNGYVLKIVNSEDRKFPEFLEGQRSILYFLKCEGFNVPAPVKNKNGDDVTLEPLPVTSCEGTVEGEESTIRLLSFVPGKPIGDCPITKELLIELGSLLARLNNALKNFHNEAIEAHRNIWHLSSVSQLHKYLHVIKEPEKMKLVRDVLESWDCIVIPAMPDLDKGIIHGDFNDRNVLVREDGSGGHHVDGFIDFGDVSYSCYVFDLAIAITYMLMYATDIDLEEIPEYVLAGYLSVRNLSDNEWIVLKEAIAARFAQSLVLGAYFFSLNPTNTYLLSTAKYWGTFEKFWQLQKEGLLSKWKRAMKSSGARILEDWYSWSQESCPKYAYS